MVRRVALFVLVACVFVSGASILSTTPGHQPEASIGPWAGWLADRLSERAASAQDAARKRRLWLAAAQSYANAARWMPWRKSLYLDAAGAYLAAGSDAPALIALVASDIAGQRGGAANEHLLRREIAARLRVQANVLLLQSLRIWRTVDHGRGEPAADDPYWALAPQPVPILERIRPPYPGELRDALRTCPKDLACEPRLGEAVHRGILDIPHDPVGVCCFASIADPEIVDPAGQIGGLAKVGAYEAAIRMGRIATKLAFVASAVP